MDEKSQVIRSWKDFNTKFNEIQEAMKVQKRLKHGFRDDFTTAVGESCKEVIRKELSDPKLQKNAELVGLALNSVPTTLDLNSDEKTALKIFRRTYPDSKIGSLASNLKDRATPVKKGSPSFTTAIAAEWSHSPEDTDIPLFTKSDYDPLDATFNVCIINRKDPSPLVVIMTITNEWVQTQPKADADTSEGHPAKYGADSSENGMTPSANASRSLQDDALERLRESLRNDQRFHSRNPGLKKSGELYGGIYFEPLKSTAALLSAIQMASQRVDSETMRFQVPLVFCDPCDLEGMFQITV